MTATHSPKLYLGHCQNILINEWLSHSSPEIPGHQMKQKKTLVCGASSAQVHGQSQTELLTRISGIVQPTWFVSAKQHESKWEMIRKHFTVGIQPRTVNQVLFSDFRPCLWWRGRKKTLRNLWPVASSGGTAGHWNTPFEGLQAQREGTPQKDVQVPEKINGWAKGNSRRN